MDAVESLKVRTANGASPRRPVVPPALQHKYERSLFGEIVLPSFLSALRVRTYIRHAITVNRILIGLCWDAISESPRKASKRH